MFQLRWGDYFIARNKDCLHFWTHYLRERTHNILFIIGTAVDPQSTIGLNTMVSAGAKDITCLRIEIEDSDSFQDFEQHTKAEAKIETLLSSVTAESYTTVKVNRRGGPQKIIDILNHSTTVDGPGYSDIVLDISGLPEWIFFPMMTELLHSIDENSVPVNFHVLVAENPECDKRVIQESPDEYAYPFPGFEPTASTEYLEDIPKIWIPILGENKEYHLRKIYQRLNPEDVCPMLPLPARNPRRCDDLIKEYYELLFDTFGVETRNFIYAAEDNPFDVYRKTISAAQHYSKSLQPLGNTAVFISCLSGKIMTAGAALAAHDLRRNNYCVAVWHLNAGRSFLSEEFEEKGEPVEQKSTQCSIWLTGECYE